MRTCKKYQQSPSLSSPHHMQVAANCRNCVYFSKYNCGTHPDPNPADTMMSLNMFAFDA